MTMFFVFGLCVVSSLVCFFFVMIRRPPRSTQSRSSAASDVYKRQAVRHIFTGIVAFFRQVKGDMVAHPQQLGEMNMRVIICLLYTSPSPRDRTRSRMPSSA